MLPKNLYRKKYSHKKIKKNNICKAMKNVIQLNGKEIKKIFKISDKKRRHFSPNLEEYEQLAETIRPPPCLFDKSKKRERYMVANCLRFQKYLQNSR